MYNNKEKYNKNQNDVKIPDCCKNCSNNPANNPNASGFCNCALPSLTQIKC